MAGGYTHGPRWALVVVGAAVLLGSGAGILSACSNTATPSAPKLLAARASSKPTPARDPVAVKAAADKAAAKQVAAVKAAAAKYAADQARGESALAKLHPMATAAAACGIPVGYVQVSPHGSRIGMPDVPKRGDIWHVKATSPVSPGMIIYWPDGGSVLCR